jgi:hypothetical protein
LLRARGKTPGPRVYKVSLYIFVFGVPSHGAKQVRAKPGSGDRDRVDGAVLYMHGKAHNGMKSLGLMGHAMLFDKWLFLPPCSKIIHAVPRLQEHD